MIHLAKSVENTKRIVSINKTLEDAFSGLVFDDSTHSYHVDGIRLESTTTFLKRFCEEFEGELISQLSAFKANRQEKYNSKRTAEYYKKRWNDQNIVGATSGSIVHNYIEHNYPNFYDPPACYQEYGAIQFIRNLSPRYKIICLEKRLCYPQLGKAGTADLIIYDCDTDTIIIADWKTNKNNIIQYYQDRTLLTPFDHLYDTDLNKYAIQLSDYQNMIEMATDLKVSDRWVIHLTQNDRNEIELSKRLAGKDNLYSIDTVDVLEENPYYTVYRLSDLSTLLKSTYSIIKTESQCQITHQ